MSDAREWIGRVDRALVRQVIGASALDLALASPLGYAAHPVVNEDGVVHASLGDAGRTFAVSLREKIEGGLAGTCSQCASRVAPCAHAAVLAVDLACSAALREALIAGRDAGAIAASLRETRRSAEVDRRFDGVLRAWLAPAPGGVEVEIAATPFDEAGAAGGRDYGDRAKRSRPIALFVRRPGGKLMTPREALAADLAPRDARVLEHARDKGPRRGALSVDGPLASVTLEAIRLHGGVFAAGFRGRLAFRPSPVRPGVDFDGAREGDSESLSAFWTTDDGATRIAFADALFLPGAFPFVWSRTGAIHPVAADVDVDLALRLEETPRLLVPSARRKEAGARIFRALRGRGVALPQRDLFGLAPVETPRIVLRLAGEPLDVVGDLVALYSGGEVPLLGPVPPGALTDGRDLVIEEEARAAVQRAGVLEGGRVGVSGDSAVAFWETGLAALRASEEPPIEVALSDRLARVRVGGALSAQVRVALEGDWLLTRVAFSSRELAVELDLVRAALARKRRWVALSDGALARITSSIAALADEAGDLLGPAGEGRLPAHQLGRLERWLSEHDGHVDASLDALRRRIRALAVAAEPDLPAGLRAPLRPYQRQGLAWLQLLAAIGAGGVFADDMGLGKTITTLAFLLREREARGPAPSLVVCPTSVAGNWEREARRFTPDLRVLLSDAGRPDPQAILAHDLVVTTYALFRRDIDALAAIPFRCAVLDEAQNVKNPDSATRRAAGRLQASMRLALTGTPVENRLGELWSLMSFANPGILGALSDFERRVERPVAADPTSPIADELRAVVRPFLLRRTKDDVLTELPPKTEIDRYVEPTRPEKRMYDALAHTLRASLARDLERRDVPVGSLSVFTAMTRLRQMACDPRLVDGRAVEPRGAKRETFLALVRELVAEGRRALVFSQFVSLLTLWRQDLDAEGIRYEYLDGATTGRDAVVDRFQSGQAPLFLLSLKAGGAGLNLTAADTVIHCDPWWNPAVEDQASDRAYRIGQDKPVTVVRLIARGTIEEKLLTLKDKKRALAAAVVGDDAAALSGITEEDVRLLLGDADPGAPGEDLTELLVGAELQALLARVRRWMDETGRSESELAAALEVPQAVASRLARGEPFPCSRATANDVLARIRAW